MTATASISRCLRNADLRRDCTYLLPDLGFPGDPAGQNIWDAPWEKRACRSPECPSRAWCPYHVDTPVPVTEILHLLFLDAVASRCLNGSQFVGRSMDVSRYQGLLTAQQIALDPPLRRLLAALGNRGYVAGYGHSNGDGIHGWLTPEETVQLADALEPLDLPRYPASFGAMEAFRSRVTGGYECASFPFEALSLSFVRTTAQLAGRWGKGVLWGNDVSCFAPLGGCNEGPV